MVHPTSSPHTNAREDEKVDGLVDSPYFGTSKYVLSIYSFWLKVACISMLFTRELLGYVFQ